MNTKVVRKIDEIGRIVLPSDLRLALGWNNNSQISILMQDNCLILRAYQNCCCVCGNTEEVFPIHKKFICQKCIDELNAQK